MSGPSDALVATLFSEILIADQLIRNRLTKVLPKGMEISHFSVLNHLERVGEERSPAQLAKSFHVTRGAMTNTLGRLEWAGYIHVRPDWDDARRKRVTISPAGRRARDYALTLISPIVQTMMSEIGEDKIRAVLPILRDIRGHLEDEGGAPPPV